MEQCQGSSVAQSQLELGEILQCECRLCLPAVGQCCAHLRAVPPILSQTAAFSHSCEDGESETKSPEGEDMTTTAIKWI